MKTHKENLDSFKTSIETMKKMIPAIKEAQKMGSLINQMFESELREKHSSTMSKLDEMKRTGNTGDILKIIKEIKENGSKPTDNR